MLANHWSNMLAKDSGVCKPVRPRRAAGAAGGKGGGVGGEGDLAAVEPFGQVGGEAGERGDGEAARVRIGLAVLRRHFEREVEERGGVLERVRVERVAFRLVCVAWAPQGRPE